MESRRVFFVAQVGFLKHAAPNGLMFELDDFVFITLGSEHGDTNDDIFQKELNMKSKEWATWFWCVFWNPKMNG